MPTDLGETVLPFAEMLMPRAHLDLPDLDDAHAAVLCSLSVRIARIAGELPDVGGCTSTSWATAVSISTCSFSAAPPA